MAVITNFNNKLGQRCEHRNGARVFVEVKPLDQQDDSKIDALTADVSESGLALITYLPLSIGTPIAINMCGCYVATGEIVDVDRWDCCGLARLGVRLTDKNDNWPL
ncbi:MAG: PilZ domain-containing protein [Acidobacteriota bacterium]